MLAGLEVRLALRDLLGGIRGVGNIFVRSAPVSRSIARA